MSVTVPAGVVAWATRPRRQDEACRLNRLRERRAVRRWSEADLADRLNVSRQTVNAIDTGRYDPSLPLAFRIAQVFGEPIESLFSPGDGSGQSATAPWNMER